MIVINYKGVHVLQFTLCESVGNTFQTLQV
jgi:hypothetical protein